jgi:site-specific recombinase XerD
MTTLNRFRIVKLSPDLQKELDLPALICANPDGLPFVEGQIFYHWMTDDNACEPSTARNYLSAILPFLTFLWEGSPSLEYAAPAEQIRKQVREYLKEKLGCVVRQHRGGNFVVRQSKTITATSAGLFLTALRRFYFFAKLKGWYTDTNPLEWSARLIPGREFKTHMPPKSGLTLPVSKKGRVPETYFCVVAEDWQPHIIDDPALRQHLLPGFIRLRDRVIARILFDSGARISEVLGLTVGDWRKIGQQTKAWTTDKGSHGERVKEIWWSSDTAQLLGNYIAQERRHCDPTRRGLDDLPDSAQIFITDEGGPYTYKAFYYNWHEACEKAGVKVTPHQVRHWFVTMALHAIDDSDTDEAQREAYRQALIAYMDWHSPETIRAYDHHLRQLDFAPVHAVLTRLDGKERAVPAQAQSDAKGSTGTKGIPVELKRLLNRAMETTEQAI